MNVTGIIIAILVMVVGSLVAYSLPAWLGIKSSIVNLILRIVGIIIIIVGILQLLGAFGVHILGF